MKTILCLIFFTCIAVGQRAWMIDTVGIRSINSVQRSQTSVWNLRPRIPPTGGAGRA